MMGRPFSELLSRFYVPDSDDSLLSASGQVRAGGVGAECHAENRAFVAQRLKRVVTQPLEVVPFPFAQVRRALLEARFHPAQVVRGPLALRQGNTLVVGITTLALQRLRRPANC